MKRKYNRFFSALLTGAVLFLLGGCVNQHPEEASAVNTDHTENPRLIATSPAVAADMQPP